MEIKHSASFEFNGDISVEIVHRRWGYPEQQSYNVCVTYGNEASITFECKSLRGLIDFQEKLNSLFSEFIKGQP